MKCKYWKEVDKPFTSPPYCRCKGEIPDDYGWSTDKPLDNKHVLCCVRVDYQVDASHYHKHYMIEGFYDRGKWWDWIGDLLEEEGSTVVFWRSLPEIGA